MSESVRDAYDLAQRIAALTGRDAYSLVRWAAQQAGTTRPGPVAAQLRHLQRQFEAGIVPADLPDPAPVNPAVRLYDEYEGQHDM